MKENKQRKRLESLDALRGFDMFFIMGGSSLLFALAALFPESGFWNEVARQMSHMPWDGLTHHDTIFPLFLFIAGVSLPYSLEGQINKGMSERAIYLKILRRGLTLFCLGIIYNGFPDFDFEHFRIFSVLGRIGLAWMLAALLYTATFRKKNPFSNVPLIAASAVALLMGYWLLTLFVPAPDAAGASVFTMQGNIACWFDRTCFGAHCYSPLYDPEGLLSTIPAIATALIGILSGAWLKYEHPKISMNKKALGLCAAGVLFAIIGMAWGLVYPINKALWSGSFVCAVAGYSLLMLALFYYVIDVRGWKRWDFFFVVIGMNSITIYLAQELLNVWHTESFLFGGAISLLPEQFRLVGHWAAYIFLCWIFLYFLYRKKIFLKV